MTFVNKKYLSTPKVTRISMLFKFSSIYFFIIKTEKKLNHLRKFENLFCFNSARVMI